MYNYAERRKWKDEKIRTERLTVKCIAWYMLLALIAYTCINMVVTVYTAYDEIHVRASTNEYVSFNTIDQVKSEEILNLQEHKNLINENFSYSIDPKDIYEYYNSKGYNDAAIAGILANIETESNFNSQEKAVKIAADGNHYGGLGIYQWNGIRIDRLKNWAYENGYHYENPFVQMAFMIKEAPYYAVTPDYMNFSNNEWGAANAAYHFAASFEKCAPEFIGVRTQKAIKWYNTIKDSQFRSQLKQLALNVKLY